MTTQPDAAGRLLAHNVFFALHDRSPEACQRLQNACGKYLAAHAGIVCFSCGTRATELRRNVNDLDFDGGLHIVFTDKAAHDADQVSAPTQQSVEENKATWRTVRVFDSRIAASPPTA